ncbi:hypothetical protein M5X11_20585 [Paenibacillus alginolyticus]|uniref:hypothetical protein n=1 Tax=Paenibacillus alginolyticus TaxID=59839 RepID=UPI00049282C9|nr:hypothetical protein [Paenibacillus alginolyticus]MCY9667290.1 hypothetical protein [Paenibacillus alginolyticus]
MKSQKTLPHARLMSFISLLIIASIISYYIYLLHTGTAQNMLKSIKDLGILPYSIAMSGIYAGVRKGSLLWGVIGAVVCIVLLGLSWLLKRRNNMLMAAKIGE